MVLLLMTAIINIFYLKKLKIIFIIKSINKFQILKCAHIKMVINIANMFYHHY